MSKVWADEDRFATRTLRLHLDHHTLSGSRGDVVRLTWDTRAAVRVVIVRPRYEEQIAAPLSGAVDIEIGREPDEVLVTAIASTGERTTDRCALIPEGRFPEDSRGELAEII